MKKKINKYELQELYIDYLQAGLPALTGVSREKLLFNIFGLVPPNALRENLKLSKVDTGRLLFIKEIVNALKGSYNTFGIRQWFLRAFAQLDNKKPCYILYRNTWKPSDPGPQKVLALAIPLSGPQNAT